MFATLRPPLKTFLRFTIFWVGGGGSGIFVFSGPGTPPIFFLGSENIWVTLGAGLGTSWKHVFCSFWQPSQSSWDPSK